MRGITRVATVLALVAAFAAAMSPSTARPAHPAGFTAASHNEPPLFPKGDYQAKRLRVVSIVPGNGTAATSRTQRLIWFGTALVASPWYSAMNAAYGLGGSTGVSKSLTANTASLGHHPTNQQISRLVNTAAHAAGIHKAPSMKTIWLVYFHCSTTTDTASKAHCNSADHESPSVGTATNFVFGSLDSLGLVMLGDGQWNDTGSGGFSLATRNASHEVIEAATDRGGTGYKLRDSNTSKPWLGGSPWTEVQSGGHTEVGDKGRVYGQYVSYALHDPTAPARNFTYDYARIFANTAANLGGDPDRPASPAPYYDTSSKHGWYKLPKTGSKTVSIPLTAWSVKQENAWTVTASVFGWANHSSSSSSAPCSSSRSRLRTGTNASQPLGTGVAVNNGTQLYLDVHYTSATSRWCVIEVKSHRTGHEPGGTGHTTPGDDLYHSWLVGVYTS